MITITQVKKYNREAFLRWQDGVNEWKEGKRQAMPFLGMFTFNLANGENRQKGYVVSNDNSHHFYLYRKDLERYINEKPNREFQVTI